MVDLSKFSRREFMRLASVAGPGLAGSDRLLATTQTGTAKTAPLSRSADEALRDLLTGNERFAKGQPLNPRRSPEDFGSPRRGAIS